MKFIDVQVIRRLKDIATDVNKRKCKNTMVQMFCIESALVKKTLLYWFNKKYRMQYLEINAFLKMQYERNNPANWRDHKCVLCKMLLRVEPTNFKTPDDEMTYGDFVIRFEHKFIGNIYTSRIILKLLKTTIKFTRNLFLFRLVCYLCSIITIKMMK